MQASPSWAKSSLVSKLSVMEDDMLTLRNLQSGSRKTERCTTGRESRAKTLSVQSISLTDAILILAPDSSRAK
jgi:hypothetical protein